MDAVSVSDLIVAGAIVGQLVVAIVIAILTSKYAAATDRYAADTAKLVAEQVQHRNLLERQLNASTIEEIREASISLWRLASAFGATPAALNQGLVTWTHVMTNRVLSLPPDLGELLRRMVPLALDITSPHRRDPIETDILSSLACEIAITTQSILDGYWAFPGLPINPADHPLPDVGDNYAEWVRERESEIGNVE